MLLCLAMLASAFACTPITLGSDWENQGFKNWSCDSFCTASLPLNLAQFEGVYQLNLTVTTESAFGKEIHVGLAGESELIHLLPAELGPHQISVEINPFFRGKLDTRLNLIVHGKLAINDIALLRCVQKPNDLIFFIGILGGLTVAFVYLCKK